MKNTKSFRRTIIRRNYREWAACALIIPSFLYMGVISESLLKKCAAFESVAAAFFIAYYLYQKSYKMLISNRSKQDIIENEIKLLSSVRYWYVLPLFLGMFGFFIDNLITSFQGHQSLTGPSIDIAITLCFAYGIIYLNEVIGVKVLNKELAK